MSSLYSIDYQSRTDEFDSLGTSSEPKSASGTGLGLGLGTGLGCTRELPLTGQEEAKVGHLLGSLLGLGQVVPPLHTVYNIICTH